jgi:hypothetical protein
LNVGENEVGVKVDRLLVVLLCLGKLALDEVQLSPVVVDVRVLGVLGQGGGEILLGLLRKTCDGQS